MNRLWLYLSSKTTKTSLSLTYLLMILLIAGCSSTAQPTTTPPNSSTLNAQHEEHSMSMDHIGTTASAPEGSTTERPAKITTPPSIIQNNQINLVAQTSYLEIEKGKYLPVWTFNNSVPGPQLEVTEGDTVTIHLKNQLKVPIALHVHGVVLPNEMDGVPGMTQDAIQPGASFTYTFKANQAGTYWYHSHQDSLNQIGKGLYGSFIVKKKQDTVSSDHTLVIDEWSDPHTTVPESESNTLAINSNMGAYNLYTVNGRSGDSIEPIVVHHGDGVRLRLVHAGNMTQTLYIHSDAYRVTATDGHDINRPQTLSNGLLVIAPGERYDIEFTADTTGIQWIGMVGDSSFAQSVRIPIVIEPKGSKRTLTEITKKITSYQAQMNSIPSDHQQPLDLTTYGQPTTSEFGLKSVFDREYTLDLDMGVIDGKMSYTINQEAYPQVSQLKVQTGDAVKITLINESKNEDHPMHLHGHSFEVLSKNGQALSGSPIWKDTINVRPGDTYVIAFRADNPGMWMVHCHELHHASMGMMTDVIYEDYQTKYHPDPEAGNISE
ncbi:multicopper oxidase family protein [Paenibacillus sp. PK4536]|uniref:multicopper oxidase family protein n=1 Tax=Paenibacillus sp. PK4536 TaxID=3024576 RepID=UPI0023582C32|nr:multicopper oxidase family protein [Paenibacillus sp. PK4536]WIM38093.1 multicopper oxidase family protein [Paenibacillus sp. PK4536]